LRLFSWRPASIGCARIPTYGSSFALCILALLIPKLDVGQVRDIGNIQPKTNANLVPFPALPVGLSLSAEGGARVDSACLKPLHHDRQRTDSPTALLTTQWTDDCSYKGSDSGAALSGAAGYNHIVAIASGFYDYSDDQLASINVGVVATMTDLLQFHIIGAAKTSKDCGLTKNIDPKDSHSRQIPVPATCIQVKFTAVWALYQPTGGLPAFSSAQVTIGDPRIYDSAIAWICNGFDLCHGGSFKQDKTITIIIDNDSKTNQRFPFPLHMGAQASVINGVMGQSRGHHGTGYFLAGVHDFKVCVDPVDGPAVRVTSRSGTDYSNAANHCY
jgi:hypothetical protein